MILNIIFGIIFAFFGAAALGKFGGAVLGFAVGWLFGLSANLRTQLKKLEARFEILEIRQESTKILREKIKPEPKDETAPLSAEKPKSGIPIKPVVHDQIKLQNAVQKDFKPDSKQPPKLIDDIKSFFTGGNIVVRFGILILFFGVAFLLKYAAQKNMLSIEIRMAGAALGGLVLLVTGWALRQKRNEYALILQGGGIGILYLTLFASAKIYGLFPLFTAFIIMAGLVILSGMLAVLQDSLALAAFGTAGGFLAPVLTSSGSGNHVMLFSYYAFLNAGIFKIAWFKAWRVLNLIGFVFTFIIGTAWGHEYYQAAYFSTTEPFLVLFFLFYVSISILFALRQPPSLKGYVDGSLVFGVPIIAFALQSSLVKGFEYGLAYSSITAGIFYLLLAIILWTGKKQGLKMLAEVFLALGIVFCTLAIPLALDNRWTSAAWALEGGALLWVGIRQNRVFTRNFGLFLQFASGMAFLGSIDNPSRIPVINGLYLGGLAISITGLFSSFYIEKNMEKLSTWETRFHIPMMAWGLCWWFGMGIYEIDHHSAWKHEKDTVLLFIILSCGIMGLLSGKLNWKLIKYPSMGLMPGLWLFSTADLTGYPKKHPFDKWGLIPWAAAFIVHLYLMYEFEAKWKENIVKIWHIGGMLLIVFILSWEMSWLIDWIVNGADTWALIPWGLVPILAITIFQSWGNEISWPVRRFSHEYMGTGSAILAFCIWLWVLAACFHSGNPKPLSYFPVFNPLDISQLSCSVLLLRWLFKQNVFSGQTLNGLYYAVSTAIFIWLNAVTARTVHYWAKIQFTAHSLHNSALFQTSITILWTLTAFGIMTAGTRKKSRKLWFTGAGLLGAVVLKLFFIDLDGSGTIARIISFLGVGCIMLIIGYVSPLPSINRSNAN
ncbi:Uncharacterized membrane protein, DUF2339 [Desulfonema limicola]|uniref:Uncharacterized membrane protein, DUF2339 n=1 Tax=Desulfonema limicola TaxID=45656 RepID=A0A975BB23_9BACT|nr:DUF2339 domain-containing protein [Desulfonema limicola]QTA82072.1 Uncharacterized membrane protein, DUF2339 [Desulfonema limicola]